MTESRRAAAFHHKQEALPRSEVQRPRKNNIRRKKKELVHKKYIQNQLEAMGSLQQFWAHLPNLLRFGFCLGGFLVFFLMITFLYLHHAVYSGTLKFTADSLSLQTARTHSSKRWAPPRLSQQGLPQPPPCHSCRIWHFPNGQECTSSSLKLISLQPGNQYLCLLATAKLIHSCFWFSCLPKNV